MTEPLISTGKLICILVSAVVGAAVPLGLLLWWRKKTGASIASAFCGAIIFVVFVYLLESALHQLCMFGDTGVSAFIKGHNWAYVLYAGLAAGIFEETGRFVAFKLILKKKRARRESIMYGIGHGGVESILVCSMSMISVAVMAFSLNAIGPDAYLASMPEAARASAEAVITGLTTNPDGLYLVSGLERIIAITLHIALSVLVFAAARVKGKGYLYPVAILLHALVDCYAVLFTIGVLPNIFITELGVAVITAAVCFFAWRVYKGLPKEGSPSERPAANAATASGAE